jgi:hypothetical protein
MKKQLLFLLAFILAIDASAQISNSLYGIVRQNYYSYIPDPFDSTIIIQQFDSATVRIGSVDLTTGYVSNVGTTAYASGINLTGAALNPYDNTYTFIGAGGLNVLDLNNGGIVNQVPLFNPIAPSFFDNFRFNNADSTLYGLARRVNYNPATQQYIGELYLSKANTSTGEITQISPTSVGQGYALAGSAIDPYQMVFYYSTGANLIGLDLYNGSVYSSAPITVGNGINFDNFTYSCADTGLYGLVRQNYFSWIPDPILDSVQVLDSATVRLGKINPTTGLVTIISPHSVVLGGYSLNGGAAIDPNTMTYYFSTGNAIVGVDMISGLKVSTNTYTFADGMYFDMMRNFESCISAVPIRIGASTVGLNEIKNENRISVFPNPSKNTIQVSSQKMLSKVTITDAFGKLVIDISTNDSTTNIDISDLISGIYFVNSTAIDGSVKTNKLIKE